MSKGDPYINAQQQERASHKNNQLHMKIIGLTTSYTQTEQHDINNLLFYATCIFKDI